MHSEEEDRRKGLLFNAVCDKAHEHQEARAVWKQAPPAVVGLVPLPPSGSTGGAGMSFSSGSSGFSGFSGFSVEVATS